MPIDPSFLTTGSEWSIAPLGNEASVGQAAPSSTSTSGASFGDALSGQINKLEGLQQGASEAARQLATGTATDPSAAVVAVDRARLAMQLAAQLRQKGLEAFNDVFHTQI